MLTTSLARRNLRQNGRRSFLVGVLIAICVAVAILGNSLLQSAVAGLRATFVDCFTGDLYIAARSEQPLSLFGVDTPVVGAYAPIPVLPFHDKVMEVVKADPAVDVAVSQVSGYALMAAADAVTPVVLFGVDGDGYFRAFPAVRIVSGDALKAGVKGAMISSRMVATITQKSGKTPVLRDSIQLSVYTDNGFTIRQVPLVGVFQFPVSSTVLDRIAYVDVDTLRSLGGMVQGAAAGVEVPPQAASALQGSLDDIFSAPGVQASGAGGSTVGDMQRAMADTAARDAGLDVQAGSWNFILVKLKTGANSARAKADLESRLEAAGLGATVGDWRTAAGSGAALASALGSAFNVGLGLLAVVVLLILANTFFIWVTQRTAEVAAMRALGARKRFVVGLIMAESLILSGVSGMLGAAGAAALVLWLHGRGIGMSNRILALVFGGTTLRPMLTVGALAVGLAGALLIGMLAILVPLRMALQVQPARAAEGQQA